MRRLRLLAAPAVVALVIAGCGPAATTADKSGTDAKGVIDKTGSSSTTDKAGSSTTTKAVAGAKKLPGAVCALLTPAEVEAVVKFGTPATPTEGDDPNSERSCTYLPSLVALTVQGEREPFDVADLRSPSLSAKRSQLRGAEAYYVPINLVTYVVKNGIAVTIQVTIPPAGETQESAQLKLAQTVADRMP